MFFPSVSKDVEYEFIDYSAFNENPLDVQKYLGMYDDWSLTQPNGHTTRTRRARPRRLLKNNKTPH